MREIAPTATDIACARWIAEARAARHRVHALPVEFAPKTLQRSYAVATAQFQLAGSNAPAAIKLGGTNVATRLAFGCKRSYFGWLARGEVADPGRLRWSEAIAPAAEPEIVVALTEDVPPDAPRLSEDALRARIAWVAVALELPDTILESAPAAGLVSLVADRCAAGRLVIGPKRASEQLDALASATWSVCLGDDEAVEAEDSLVGGPLGALSDFLAVYREAGLTLTGETPVSLGGMTRARPVAFGAPIEVRVNGCAALAATVDRGPAT